MDQRDIVIIGGGPAGLSAGIYAARAALNTLLLERGVPGGMVVNTQNIENYPGVPGTGGPELMMQMVNQASGFGVDIKSTNVERLEPSTGGITVITDSGPIKAGAVIIATGAQPQLLNVKGEAEYTGRGVSYCATCDGAFFRGKKVVVVGGGDAAVEEAMYLTRFAEKVYIVHRRGELRATRIIQQRAFLNPKIQFIWHSVVDEISGTDTVNKTLIRDVRDNSKTPLEADGVFIYVGYLPNSSLVKGIVTLDDKGYIITGDNMLTSQPGIYAAGDVRQKLLRQVVTAVADGAIAAVAAEKYLESKRK